MVYGLNVKPVHGYYISTRFESIEGKIELLPSETDDGVNPRGREWRCGLPVDPTFVPTRAHYLDRKRHPLLPDFVDSGIISVSTRAKDIIESMETTKHQFFPIEYMDIKGKHMEHRWLMNVCNRLDTIDRQHVRGFVLETYPAGNKHWVRLSTLMAAGDTDLVPPDYDRHAPVSLVFNTKQIGGAHIWHDKHLTSGGTFISDALVEAFAASDITGIEPTKVEAV